MTLKRTSGAVEPRPNIPAAYRTAEPADVPTIVAIHLATFRGFFLSFLGGRFLNHLYEEMITDAGGVVVVAEADGEVAGFAAGVTDQRLFFRRLLEERKWAFARAALGALLRRPGIAPRLLRALRKDRDVAPSAAASLMSIGVYPRALGVGMGRGLIRAFDAVMNERGVGRYCLTTDAVENDAVNRFYERCGFERARQFRTREGRLMNEYVRQPGKEE